MITYNPLDWYWIVNNDDSRFWSSAASKYVSALPQNAGVTRIDSEANLSEVLAVYGLSGPIPVVPKQVPMWAVRTVMHNYGLFDRVQEIVESSTDIALKNVWEYGNFADRNSVAINTIASTLGLTEAQVNQMFIDANAISV